MAVGGARREPDDPRGRRHRVFREQRICAQRGFVTDPNRRHRLGELEAESLHERAVVRGLVNALARACDGACQQRAAQAPRKPHRS